MNIRLQAHTHLSWCSFILARYLLTNNCTEYAEKILRRKVYTKGAFPTHHLSSLNITMDHLVIITKFSEHRITVFLSKLQANVITILCITMDHLVIITKFSEHRITVFLSKLQANVITILRLHLNTVHKCTQYYTQAKAMAMSQLCTYFMVLMSLYIAFFIFLLQIQKTHNMKGQSEIAYLPKFPIWWSHRCWW